MSDAKYREGAKFVTAIPSEDGACVAMCEYKGQIFLACQYAIYQFFEKDNTFKKVKFEVEVKDWK